MSVESHGTRKRPRCEVHLGASGCNDLSMHLIPGVLGITFEDGNDETPEAFARDAQPAAERPSLRALEDSA